MNPQKVAEMRRQLISFASKMPMAKAPINVKPSYTPETLAALPAVVMAFKPAIKKPAPLKAALRMPRQRQAMAAAR
jgi:hypothetical protein